VRARLVELHAEVVLRLNAALELARHENTLVVQITEQINAMLGRHGLDYVGWQELEEQRRGNTPRLETWRASMAVNAPHVRLP
jgi:hypothetical protein